MSEITWGKLKEIFHEWLADQRSQVILIADHDETCAWYAFAGGFAVRDEEIATLQRELEQERKRLNWMAANHGRIEYFDEKREFLVEYADPDSTEFDYINGPIVQHDWKAAIDAAIAQAEGGEDANT